MSNPIITTTQAQNVVFENFGTLNLVNMIGDENVISIPHGLTVIPQYINVLYSDPNNAALAAAEISVDANEIFITNLTTAFTGTVKIWWTAKFKF